MASSKSKIALGLLVAGTLTVVFGIILVFAGPIIVDDQIVKVGHEFTFDICGDVFRKV